MSSTTVRKPVAKPAPEPETIQHAYLMWVGSDSYPGITDWSDEAIAMGISKRLPSVDVGRALMREGVAIFVAHDEGETHDCPTCIGRIECPECRKRAVERVSLQGAIDLVRSRYGADWETAAAAGDARFVAIRMDKVQRLDTADAECTICRGEASYMAGTGGRVVLDDGAEWDYRRFNYWLHQPTKFDPSCVVEREMCADCGGTGELPNARVFGMFVPERVEYILDGTEDEEKMDEVKAFVHVTPKTLKGELKRKCGTRRPGGVYVVTESGSARPKAMAAVAELVERGLVKPDATELHGSFVRFTEPVVVMEKRFRGIKSIELTALDSALADEASMIIDALKS